MGEVMGTYSKLLETYKKYLSEEEVKENDRIISVLTLWKVVQAEIEKFQFYRDDNKGLISHINNIYKIEHKKTFQSGIDNYDYATKNFDVRIPVFKPIKFIKIKSGYTNDRKTAVIEFILNTKAINNKKIVNESIKVYRDFGDDAYYGDHINRFLIYHCKEQLDEIVNFLEFFAPIADGKNDIPIPGMGSKICPIVKSHDTHQFIDNGILYIDINHVVEGKPSLTIKLSDDIDYDNSQYKKYSDESSTIIDLIESNTDELLKRTYVSVNDLGSFCKRLVLNYLEVKEQKRTLMEENQNVYKKVR